MKIDINKVKIIPNNIGNWGFCIFGEPDTELEKWIECWGLKSEISGKFTNIYPTDNFNVCEAFDKPNTFKYVDGFSPNLNKHLHIGHVSNLVIANALQHMDIGEKFIAILGDTLNGVVAKDDALVEYDKICKTFDYKVSDKFFASDMKIKNSNLLSDGVESYTGTKVFEIGDDEKIVGIKNNSNTTYFYQDVALAEYLDSETLYLTGVEQCNHFKTLSKLFPKVKHIGLGLVNLGGKKMSSSEGNVIMLNDFIDSLMVKFDNNIKLVYNVIAGFILKSAPETAKNINMDIIDNPKQSMGLYLSYTMAHIKSCGVETFDKKEYTSKNLQFCDLKSKVLLSPQILFSALVEHCKMINKMYETHYIKNNEENILIFSDLISDLKLGMETLGMFSIDKV